MAGKLIDRANKRERGQGSESARKTKRATKARSIDIKYDKKKDPRAPDPSDLRPQDAATNADRKASVHADAVAPSLDSYGVCIC